jgi:hypothetical protein
VIALYDQETRWALLLDLRRGKQVMLNPTMGYVWHELEEGRSVPEAIAMHVYRGGREPGPGEIRELARHGMLTARRPTSLEPAVALISHEVPPSVRVSATDEAVSRRDVGVARLGFAIAVAIVHLPLPFSTRLRMVRSLAGMRRQRPTLAATWGNGSRINGDDASCPSAGGRWT